MYNIYKCPCCNSRNIIIRKSSLSKFVVWRILNIFGDSIDNNSIFCQDCYYYGSMLRFTDEEIKLLYDNYRGDLYNKMRIICEPEYNSKINSFEDAYHNDRLYSITKLIETNVTYSIDSILDYGGDSGSHIPKILDAKDKYVFDVSDIVPIEGVKKINFGDPVIVDFIMCCHVLEHVSDLVEILNKIKKFSHKDTYFYFEVPKLYTPIEQLVVPMFHEHINFFCFNSLSVLLNNNGFTIMDADDSIYLALLCVLR